MSQPAKFYDFGQFRLDPDSRLLWRDGAIVSLPPKIIDLLLLLVESRGRLVTKDQLMSAVWPDSFVEESNLTSYISILRKSLGQRTDGGEFIETIPKRGYRFVVPICESATEVSTPRSGSSRSIWIVLAGVLLVAGATAAVAWKLFGTRPPGIRSVVVLPFLNLSQDRENEYFSDGLTEELIDSLSRIEGLRVVRGPRRFSSKAKPSMFARLAGSSMFKRFSKEVCAKTRIVCG